MNSRRQRIRIAAAATVGVTAAAIALFIGAVRELQSIHSWEPNTHPPASERLDEPGEQVSVAEILQRVPAASALHRAIPRERSPFAARLEAIHVLPDDLDATEIAALYAYLKLPPVQSGGVVEKNDLLNALRRQKARPPEFARLLADIYYDPAQDVVLRDYALQHAVLWYVESKDQRLIVEILTEALDERQSSIAGTALIGLYTLYERHRAVDAGVVRQSALDILADPGARELAKITSLRIAADLGASEALPVARAALRQTASIPMRIAAFATLGDLGNESDLAALRDIAAEPDPRLEAAVRRAIEKLTGA